MEKCKDKKQTNKRPFSFMYTPICLRFIDNFGYHVTVTSETEGSGCVIILINLTLLTGLLNLHCQQTGGKWWFNEELTMLSAPFLLSWLFLSSKLPASGVRRTGQTEYLLHSVHGGRGCEAAASW